MECTSSATRSRFIELHRSILQDLGHEMHPEFMILDFGCGEGDMVQQYRNAGYKAFGIDIKLDKQNEFLRPIFGSNGSSYRIPFDDSTFDFVYSNQVLEHVVDLRSALSEIHRVLRPGGVSLHIFPPKLKPVEAHVFVPFGGTVQRYSWLLFWAFLGVRNAFQKGLSCKEVARRNYEYLHTHTFYRSKKEIRKHVVAQFHNVVFAERYLIKHSYGRARQIFPLVKVFPSVAFLYGSLHARVVFSEKLQAAS
jgi:SAM-dependent methyltransferase